MEDREALDMMRRCRDDIKRLRDERDRLTVPAEAYGVIRDIVRMSYRGNSVGMGEDVLWTLEKRIREIEEAMKPVPPTKVAD